MEITTFDDEDISGIVSFWNDTFSDRRNFLRMTPARFQERILNVNTSMESFAPEQFLVARENNDVLGIMHVGTHPEPICRLMYGDEWEGGELGYVGMIAVHPERRDEGIGGALWKEGVDQIAHTPMITLDGQCLNPYYGNSLGPFQPMWGTTEGISIRPTQEETMTFFERRGFEPAYEGVSLEVVLDERPDVERSGKDPTLNVLEETYPALGEPSGDHLPYPDAEGYIAIQLVQEDLTVGILSVYPFRELEAQKWGIYEFQMAEEYRGNGNEKRLLSTALDEVAERGGERCEAFVLEEIAPDTLTRYEEHGFEEVARWKVY